MVFVRWLAVVSLVFCVSCATGAGRSEAELVAQLKARTGALAPTSERKNDPPPDVDLTDGADEQEIVALAFWNNPAFRANLSDLGLSEANLIAVRTPRNPTLTLFDPANPAPFQGAVAIPIDILRRPARIDAARTRLEQTSQTLIQNGLALARDARVTFADLARARERASLLDADATAASTLAGLAEEFESVGRGAGVDTAIAQAAAAAARVALENAHNEEARARIALEAIVATTIPDVIISDVRLQPSPDKATIEAAAANRPDLLAANLSVAAARRDLDGLGLEVLQPGALVDLRQADGDKLRVSAGGTSNLPLFDRGQAARRRAQAALDRALAERDGVRLSIGLQIDGALENQKAADRALKAIDAELIPSTERRANAIEAIFSLGRASLLEVVVARRDLIAARLQKADASAAYRRAIAELKFAAGVDVVVTPEESGAS